jgi:hypothetical protein
LQCSVGPLTILIQVNRRSSSASAEPLTLLIVVNRAASRLKHGLAGSTIHLWLKSFVESIVEKPKPLVFLTFYLYSLHFYTLYN